jgi:choline transport protein
LASTSKKEHKLTLLRSLGLILSSGGPVAMTWGLCVSAVGSLAMCTTLAEICHVYPTVGGQYDWAYVLAPEGYRRGLAWIAGWMTAVSGRLLIYLALADAVNRPAGFL